MRAGDRSEALRFKGPAVETIKLEAEIDATDQLEFPDQHRGCRRARHPAAARGAGVAGLSDQPRSSGPSTSWRSSGTLEIAPMEAPLTLFVWSKNRIVPVRVTEFSITEEAFDPALNPIRAKVSLGLRVLIGGRPRLRPQGRQPLHELPASEGAAGGQGPGGHLHVARHRGDRHDAIRYRPSCRRTRSRRRCSRRPAAITASSRRSSRGRTARRSVYLRRRFVPPPERFALLREHVVAAGDRLDNLAAQYLGDPAAVLAHLRRQPRDAARRADRRRSDGACASRCPTAFPA